MTRSEFVTAILANPINRTILERLPKIGLPDAWLVSGAVFQTVWNVLTERDPQHGIKDYDVFYFDPDTSWDAEDAAIHKAQDAFGDLDAEIELRNQARVHLWYEQKFGVPYPALSCACDGIDRFLMHCAQIGIRPAGDEYVLYAPHGLADIVEMCIRPNQTPNFHPDRYGEKAVRWKMLWPELTIIPA